MASNPLHWGSRSSLEFRRLPAHFFSSSGGAAVRRNFLVSAVAVNFAMLWLAGCGGYSSGSLNGGAAPYITTQPANQTVVAGQTATFSVTASGTTPLS